MTSQQSTAYFNEGFANQQFMVILRGLSPARTIELCTLAWNLSITQVEVPIESDSARESLEAAIEAGTRVGRRVGAGTIVRAEQATWAARAGVAFTVAPGLDEDVIKVCTDLDLPHLPGVATAGEVQRAQRLGCEWVKAFPASVLGADWVRAMLGPFPRLKVVATGGMDVGTADTFLGAGARAVALGSSLENRAELDRLSTSIRERAATRSSKDTNVN